MFRVFLFLTALIGCNGDDGKIDEVCDEIPEPCHWETADDADDADTGDS